MSKQITVQDGNLIIQGSANMELQNDLAISWLDVGSSEIELLNLGTIPEVLASWPEVTTFTSQDISEFLAIQSSGFTFNDDGTRGYVSNFNNSTGGILQSVVYSTAYDPDDSNSPVNVLAGEYYDFEFGDSGTKIYTCEITGTLIEERENTGTAYNPANGDLTTLNDTFVTTGTPTGVHMKTDGTMFWYCNAGATVYEITMGTPWDLTTASQTNTFVFTGRSARKMRFSPDGVTIYMLESDEISEYTCSTAFDITSAVYAGRFITSYTGAIGTDARGFDLSPDSTTLVVQTQWGNTAANNETVRFTGVGGNAAISSGPGFIVGDPLFNLSVDGLTTRIKSPATTIHGTTDLLSTLNVSGNITAGELTWDGQALLIDAAGGVHGMEVDTSAAADKSYMGVWNNDTMQYIELGVHGSTYAGTPPMTMQFATTVGELQFLGDNGNHLVMRDITFVPHTDIPAGAVFRLGEKTTAGAFEAAYGQLWVKDDAPTTLMYTDDTGADFVIGGATPASFTAPISIVGDINTATPPTTEGITAHLNFVDLAQDDIIGQIGYDGENELVIEQLMQGGTMLIRTTGVTAGNGGDLNIVTANTTTSGISGDISLSVGNSAGTDVGGAVNITAGGSGAGATGDGGAVIITSGESLATNGSGGDITLTAGVGTGSGVDGTITLNNANEIEFITEQLVGFHITDNGNETMRILPRETTGAVTTKYIQYHNDDNQWTIQGDIQFTQDGGSGSVRMASGMPLISAATASNLIPIQLTGGTFPTTVLNDGIFATGVTGEEGVWGVANQLTHNLSNMVPNVLVYRFDTSTTTSANLANNDFRMNNATPASVTEIAFDDLTQTGGDFGTFWAANLSIGDKVFIKQQDDDANYIVCTLSGTPVDNTGAWRMTVTVDSSGTIFDDNKPVSVQFISGTTGSGNVSNVGTPVDNQIAVWTGANTIEGDTNLQWTGTNLALTGTTHLLLPLTNDDATPTLAFGDGDTGFYEVSDDTMGVSVAGTQRYAYNATAYASVTAGGFYLDQTATSATNPALSFQGDTDTGIGSAAADELSLIAGGVEANRITAAAVQTTTAGVAEIISVAITSGDAWGFEIHCVGTEDATGDTVFERVFGAIRNQGGTTALVGSTITDRTDDVGASTWVISVEADDTGDALTVDVTGEGSHTIDWKVRVEILLA